MTKLPIARTLGTSVAGGVPGNNTVPVGQLRKFGFSRLTDRFPDGLNLRGRIRPRPTIVVIARPPGGLPLSHSAEYYDKFFFDTTDPQSFAWVMNSYGAAPIRVLAGPPPIIDLSDLVANLDQSSRASAIMKMLVDAGQLSTLADIDDAAENDDIVTTGEIFLVVVDTYSTELANSLVFSVDEGNPKIAATVSYMGHQCSLMTACHEVFHQWGAVDLYGDGSMNVGLTQMAATIFGYPDDRRCYELDPWHRMQFGVTAPVLVDLAQQTEGSVEIKSVARDRENSAVLFWDSRRGRNGYIMVELREPVPNTVDRDVSDGIAVWVVRVDQNGNPESPGNGIPGVAAIGKIGGNGSGILWSGGDQTGVIALADGSSSLLQLAFARPDPSRAVISWSTAGIRPPPKKVPLKLVIKSPVVPGQHLCSWNGADGIGGR